ncbi:MAG: response regulator [Polyangiaceae bacterium]|nr:response regulator [Polyangiaceae bacterium]
MADLPLREGERSCSAEDPRSALDGGKATRERARVVICDDERRLATLMAGLLEQHGYDAVPASSGSELLELIRNGRVFDAVVLDVNLAGEDTASIIRALQEYPSVPVILSSGYGEDDLPLALRREPNVRGYVGKPYTADRLVSAIEGARQRPSEP